MPLGLLVVDCDLVVLVDLNLQTQLLVIHYQAGFDGLARRERVGPRASSVGAAGQPAVLYNTYTHAASIAWTSV